MGGLQLERLVGAIGGYAGSESALQYALQYMAERKAFGRTINKFVFILCKNKMVLEQTRKCLFKL